MTTNRECTSNSFIKRTIVLFFTCVGFSYIILYAINSELLRFHYGSQYKIKKLKELIESNPEDTELQRIIYEHFRLTEETSSSKTQTNGIAPNNLGDLSRFKDSNVVEKDIENEGNVNVESNEIKIIVYCSRQIRLSHEIDLLDMSVCAASNCKVHRMPIQINGTLLDADAIVIQGNRMPEHIPSRRDSDQVLVFLNNEPPMLLQITDLSDDIFVNYFNWTMTYRTNSDIPFLYGAVVKQNAQFDDYVNKKERKKRNELYLKTDMSKNYSAIYRAKNKNVFWIVSHCLTPSKREKYVTKMKDHIDVDQFGGCNENKIGRKQYYSAEMWTQYKFYLAFENTYCIDYITEKVFNWFEVDVILVVRGGCDYTKFLPNGTYVNADDFENAAALSKYLHELGNNESEYVNILRRKDKYRVYKEQEMLQSSFCDLCEKLNNVNDHIKSVKDMYEWWKKGACRKTKKPS